MYLHHVLDEWMETVVKPRMRGEMYLIRYADDLITCFQHREDAERVAGVLRKRFAKYGLELHEEKTRLIPFGRFAERDLRVQGQHKPPTFDFLGFTHICARGRNGKFTVHVRTARARVRRAMKRMAEWCRDHRHRSMPEQHRALSRALLRHYAYYGRVSNSPSLATFFNFTKRTWLKWLLWTPAQVQLFLDSFPYEDWKWQVFAELLLLAGLRFGEAAALSPGQVSAETVTIDRSWDERGKRIKPTKSGRARTVDLHPRLKRDLLIYLERTNTSRDELLFPGERRGRCVSNSWFAKKVWRGAIDRAALPWIRPHDARHTFVAHLLEAGANPVYVQQQAGHHSAAFTLDVYGHLIPSQKLAHNLPTNNGIIEPQQDLRP